MSSRRPKKPLALLPEACRTSVATKLPAASVSKDTPRPSNELPATRFANEPNPESAKRLPMPPRSKLAAQQVGRADRAVEHAEARRQRCRRRARSCRSRASRCCRAASACRRRVLVSDACGEVVDLAAQARSSRCRARGRRGRRRGWRRSRSPCRRRRPPFAVFRPTRRLLASVAPAREAGQRSAGAESRRRRAERCLQRVVRRRDRCRVGDRHGAVRDRVAAVDDAEVDDRGVHLRRRPACRRGRRGRRSGPASARSAAPVVPAPLETKLTPAVPLKTPAAPVLSATPSALLDAPAARPVIEPRSGEARADRAERSR